MTNDVCDLSPAAVALVKEWLDVADKVPAPRAARQLAGMLQDRAGLDFVVGFVDHVIRPEDLNVAAANLARLGSNPPAFLDLHLKTAVRLGAALAPRLPGLVVPIARRVLRQMVSHLIIDATPRRLTSAIQRMRRSGVTLNLNLLGETVLGEKEAARRLAGTRKLLERDDVDYVSVKVSSVVKPQQRWGFDAIVEHTIEKLRPLYRLAASSARPKFINLDMEEYKDLELTLAVFTQLLAEQEFQGLPAGIVLQSYLPDALNAMIRLQGWAANRVASGGAPIKVRLVKGANLPMEMVDAELHNWPLATVDSKQAADTNYKRVMDYALHPERIKNVRLGVAGHNLFDLALAWLLAERRGTTAGIDFEMLVGMAPGQAEAVRRTVGGMLLYVPVIRPAEFDVAIAYLIRRLEEGASQDNFMSAIFELSGSTNLFEREKARFLASVEDLDTRIPQPNRCQTRLDEEPTLPHNGFVPTADSDPALPSNQRWAASIRAEMAENRISETLTADSRVSDAADLERRIGTALSSQWGSRSGAERAEILHGVGDELARRRGSLIAIAGAECGKTIDQSDPEVSEAVDFAHYYAELARDLERVDGAEPVPAELIVVTPPWNFPIAIPSGSMLSALAAGASVIVKPARLAARSCAAVVEAMWAAGVPKDALQFVLTDESSLATALVSDPRVGRVILTGGYETAQHFKQLRPEIGLLAETSGKNAIIVTPAADVDLAVKDVLSSAFGHAGQKCSAASLVILVGEAAHSARFRNQLVDGVRSLTVGWPQHAESEVGPLISAPTGKLLNGLTKLEPGQSWLVEPRKLDDTGRLWQPGVRAGVQRGSEFHRVEYFGPVLGIMTAATLDEAIDIVNELPYGLTSGLHSLDSAEIDTWLKRIQAGNLYVNRGTTGAIVQRQPFGGWKRSVVGPTTKAGGPNYLLGLSDWKSAPATSSSMIVNADVRRLLLLAEGMVETDHLAFLHRAATSDQQAWETEFGISRDVQGLRCERNVLRYVPCQEPVTVRLQSDGHLADLLRVVAAALRVGHRPAISCNGELPGELRAHLLGLGLSMRRVSDGDFTTWLSDAPAGRIRMIGALSNRPPRADIAVYEQPVTEAGRIEALPFLYEQSISITAHRFGTPDGLTAGLL